MEISRELLEKRMKALEAQKQQFIANVNACEGGIVTIRGLLSDLDREETDEKGEQATESAPLEE